MAIFHFSTKAMSRSNGRSATGSAAYRAGCKIKDERSGLTFDYSKKKGVMSSDIILPATAPAWANDRAKLWNAAEVAEKRKNSTVCREFEIALPSELSPELRKKLAIDFATEVVKKHGCVAEVSIHAPSAKGDNRNYHAHILLSTRRLTAEGFTEKTRELDDKITGPENIVKWRERFAFLQNELLQQANIKDRVDHRSFKEQGITREPTKHLGVAAIGFERRTGLKSEKRKNFEKQIAERAHQRQLQNLQRVAINNRKPIKPIKRGFRR